MGDIDIEVVDGLKALDPERPIREGDKNRCGWIVRDVPQTDISPRRRYDVTGH